jgi:hypothetical protein
VVVGDVTNIAAFGSQKITDIPNSPWPPSPEIPEIYWCQADFRADSVVKGSLPNRGKKFLWAAIRPGCSFEWFRYGYEETAEPVTRIWFVREEGEYIRPVVDGGGVFFVSFHGKWFDPPKEEAPKTLALLMLNPAALGWSPTHYATIFQHPVGLALAILGKTELIARLKALAATPDRTLRETVCGYLESEFDQACR